MGWDEIKVFVSSTFRDMHAERDWLVQRTFPLLRERLAPYRIHLDDVDLRWGITAEQAEHDRALPICLRHVRTCRPFFLCLLGERYGYVPGSVPQDVTSEFPWTDGLEDRSVTELEIRCRLAAEEAGSACALFFFRDPAFIRDVPDGMRADVEPEDPARMRALKTEIRSRLSASGSLPPKNYACRYAGIKIDPRTLRDLPEADRAWLEARLEGSLVDPTLYAGILESRPEVARWVHGRGHVYVDRLETFGQQVLDRLWTAIEATLDLESRAEASTGLSGVTPPSDESAEEEEHHVRFMESRLRVFAGRTDSIAGLLAFAEAGATVPLVLTGPAGSGKSSILAKFVSEYERRHPGDLVIPHFVGASAASTDLRRLLTRLCRNLQVHYEFEEELPASTEELVGRFRQWIAQVPGTSRVLVVIDALNQLSPVDRAHHLHWLPAEWAPNVTLICSCLDQSGESTTILNALESRRPHRVDVEPLEEEERRQILVQVPSLSAKSLDPFQTELFLTNPATANPLFLRVALEELRGCGSFEHVDRFIARLPRPHEPGEPEWRRWLDRLRSEPQDGSESDTGDPRRLEDLEEELSAATTADRVVPRLFEQVLQRLEDEFSHELVQGLAAPLAASRYGLSEFELLSLPRPHGTSEDMYALIRLLRPYLMHRGAQIDLYHDALRDAVVRRYMPDQPSREGCHRTLAAYFDSQGYQNVRALSELPFHLEHGVRWDRLETVLLDPAFVAAKCSAGMTYELQVDFERWLSRAEQDQDEGENDAEHRRLVEQYASSLQEYAEACLRARLSGNEESVIPDVAELPPCEPLNHEELERRLQRQRERPSPRDRARIYSRFVRSQSHHLARYAKRLPRFCEQQMLNGGVVTRPDASWEADRPEETDAAWIVLDEPFRETPNPAPLLERVLSGHLSRVNDVGVSAVGQAAVSGCGTGESWQEASERALRVWDLATGQCLYELPQDGIVEDVLMTPDGRTAIVGLRQGGLRVWDLVNGQCLASFDEAQPGLQSITMTPDAGLLLTLNKYGALAAWEVAARRRLTEVAITDILGSIEDVSVSPDGRHLVTAGEQLAVMDLHEGTARIFATSGDFTCLSHVLPGSGAFAVGNAEAIVRIGDIQSGKCIRELRSTEGFGDEWSRRVQAVELTSDAVCAVGYADKIEVWDGFEGKRLRTLSGAGEHLAVSADGRCCISAEGSRLKVWNLHTGNDSKPPADTRSSESEPALTSGERFMIRPAVPASAWCMATGRQIPLEGIPEDQLRHPEISRDGRLVLAAGQEDHIVRMWHVGSEPSSEPTPLRSFPAQDSYLQSIRLSPDERFALTSAGDGRLWDLETAEPVFEGEMPESGGWGADLSPDGRFVALADEGHSVAVWDWRTRTKVAELRGHSESVGRIRFTPDGRTLVTGCSNLYESDQQVRIWDWREARCRLVVRASPFAALFTVSLDGTVLALYRPPEMLECTDMATGELVAAVPITGVVPYFRLDGALRVPTAEGPIRYARTEGLVREPLVVTVVRRWRVGPPGNTGAWDDAWSAFCPGCAAWFQPADQVVRALADSSTGSCRELPDAAWSEPDLLAECPACGAGLRFNPFVVDNRA